MKSRWTISVKAQASTLEIDIYDDIGAGLMGGITAQDVLEQLKSAKGAKQILVRINSSGGEVTQGMAIYSLLRDASSKGAEVVCRIDGLAASIASVIACAGDRVEMADTAYLMIHNPSAMISGGETDLRSMADLLASMKKQMLGIYAQRTGKPVEELAALCDAETWMTAEEAKAAGFITDIIPSKARMVAQWDLTQFKKVPKGLTAMDEKEYDALKEENDKLKARIADLEEKAAKDEESDEDDEDEKKSEKSDDDDDSDQDGDKDEKDAKASAHARVIAAAKAITGVSDPEALEGALYALQVRAKGTRSSKAQHAERVEKAISDGKLPPSLKKWALSTNAKAFDGYLAGLGDNVLPVAQELKPISEDMAKAIAFRDAPKAELSKSEKALAKSLNLTEAELIKMKADQLQGNAA